MKPFADEFEKYFQACYRNVPGVTEVQRREVRQAFFAGALACINHMFLATEPGTAEPSEAEMGEVSALIQEIKECVRPPQPKDN